MCVAHHCECWELCTGLSGGLLERCLLRWRKLAQADSCYTEPTNPDDCNKKEAECPRIVLRPQVTIIEQGSLISGRLAPQLIEGARIYQFYGTVNEKNAVSVNDLYSWLYDREVSQTEERRSTQINFRQTMWKLLRSLYHCCKGPHFIRKPRCLFLV